MLNIESISPSTGTFDMDIRLWFDFNIDSYFRTIMYKIHPLTDYEDLIANKDKIQDKYIYNRDNDRLSNGRDFIPDYMQLDDFNIASSEEAKVSPYFLEMLDRLPGQTTTNNYPDNEAMFIIGNGSISPDTFLY